MSNWVIDVGWTLPGANRYDVGATDPSQSEKQPSDRGANSKPAPGAAWVSGTGRWP